MDSFYKLKSASYLKEIFGYKKGVVKYLIDSDICKPVWKQNSPTLEKLEKNCNASLLSILKNEKNKKEIKKIVKKATIELEEKTEENRAERKEQKKKTKRRAVKANQWILKNPDEKIRSMINEHISSLNTAGLVNLVLKLELEAPDEDSNNSDSDSDEDQLSTPSSTDSV